MRRESLRPCGRYRPCAAACGAWLGPSEPPYKHYCSKRCRQRGYRSRGTTDTLRPPCRVVATQVRRDDAQRQARFRQKMRALATEPERLRSGNYRDICPECGVVTVACSAADLDGAHCACPPTRYEYVVQLDCSLCARPVGSFRVGTPHARIVLLRPVRCPACGGTAVQGDVVRVAVVEPIDVRDQPPRRGRPPKWLVEQHRLQGTA